MKLNESQIAEIQKYILDWGIEYKEFFDEILDHFVTSIERQMGDGIAFYDAFHSIVYTFSGKKFKKTKTDTYYGLKAFEMENLSISEHNMKTELKKTFLKQITSFRLFLWVLFLIVIFRFDQYLKSFFEVLLAFHFIQLLFILYLTSPKYSFNNLLPIKQQTTQFKKKHLKHNFIVGAVYNVIATSSVFIISVVNIGNSFFSATNSEINYSIKKVIFIALTVFSATLIEVLFKVTKKEKLRNL